MMRNSSSTIYDKLRSAIIAGELAGGSPLRQAELGARYGVSKIPVREALRQLEAQGFVTIYPGRGAVVMPLSADEAEEIYLMRIALEPILLARSIPNLTPLDYARANAALHLVDTMDGLPPADWHKLDGEFHTILYQAAPLERIQRQVATLRGNLARYFGVFQTLGDEFRTAGNIEHRTILDACQAGQIEAACDDLRKHLERSSAELLDALKREIENTI
ncbi:MAG: GntR family transcriptional regulator [Candidatus Promineifilaceae bacterium]